MVLSIQVMGFSGSLRKRSYNTALLRAAVELLPSGMTIDIFDLSPIPLYNADLEATGFPEIVQTFREHIADAHALLIATPEYNYSISGVLKNALDWASRPPSSPLTEKPVAIMGAGGRFGTVRAQLHLRQIMLHNNMLPMNKPEVMLMRAQEHFDAEGRLINEQSRQAVRDLLEALAAWTERVHRN